MTIEVHHIVWVSLGLLVPSLLAFVAALVLRYFRADYAARTHRLETRILANLLVAANRPPFGPLGRFVVARRHRPLLALVVLRALDQIEGPARHAMIEAALDGGLVGGGPALSPL